MFIGISTKIRENLLLCMYDHGDYIIFNALQQVFIAVRIAYFYGKKNFSMDVYAFEIVSDLVNVITGAVLGVEIFARTNWDFMEKWHYIPTCMLCGFSNILSIIVWWKAWSYDGMEDSDRIFQPMIFHGISIGFVALYTYLDGLFIYHKLQNTEEDINEHITAVASFVTAAFNILFRVSTIYFIIFSTSIHLHVWSEFYLIMMMVGYGFSDTILDFRAEILFFRRNYIVLCGTVVFIAAKLVIQVMYWHYFYDQETAEKLVFQLKNAECVDSYFASRFLLHYFATAARSICLLQRTLPDEEDMDSDEEDMDWDSEIYWRRSG